MRSAVLKQIVVTTILSCCASGVMAQYVWLNAKGVKQYSDQPPPASVPNNKILKTPRGIVQNVDTTPAEAADADSDTAKKAVPPSIADKNAEFEKRRKEQADKDKKAEEKVQQDAIKKKNCEDIQAYNRALSSGQRISRVNSNGERTYLSDEEIAKEASNNKRAMADCK